MAVEHPDPHQDPRLGSHRLHRVIDCLLEREGSLEVWDWKSKIRLDENWLGDTIREAAHAWQLHDYAWHAQQWFGKPVTRAGHGLVVLGPKLLAKPILITITPERLIQWRSQAELVWRKMYEGPWHENWVACSDKHLHYGKECIFVPACHSLCGNETLFGGVYKRKDV